MHAGYFWCCCCTLTFFKINVLKTKKYRNTIRVSNCLDQDQDQRSVGPDLGPNCLKCYHKTTNVAAGKEMVNKSPLQNWSVFFLLQVTNGRRLLELPEASSERSCFTFSLL